MDHPALIQMPHSPSSIPVLAATPVLPPKHLNTSIYLDLNRFSRQTAWAHGFMHHYALWLGPVLVALFFVATYAIAWWRGASRVAALLILGGIGEVVSLGLNQLVAHAAKELRPYVTHPSALVLVAKANDYAFPSDHSVVAGGLTASLLLVVGGAVWRQGPGPAGGSSRTAGARAGDVPAAVRIFAALTVVLGLFLCFARVYVGAHYPGDVVAGYLMAALVVVLFSLLRPLAYRVVDVVEPTALGSILRRPGSALTV